MLRHSSSISFLLPPPRTRSCPLCTALGTLGSHATESPVRQITQDTDMEAPAPTPTPR